MITNVHIGQGISPRTNYVVYMKQVHSSEFLALSLHQNVYRQHRVDEIYKNLDKGKTTQGYNLIQ